MSAFQTWVDELHRGATIQFCRRLYHVQFFVHTDAAHGAIVLDPYEQPASVSIGKRDQGSGNFPAVVDARFEVLLLVLPFRDHSKDVRHEAKMAPPCMRCPMEYTGFLTTFAVSIQG